MKLEPGQIVKVDGCLDLSSLTTLPEGVTLSAGGDLYLSSLTTLPEGVTLSAGGRLYLSSLTTLPEGVTLSAGGYSLKPRPDNPALASWQEEKKTCEGLFAVADPQVGDWCAWLHHELQFEKLTEPWENRVKYVAEEKPRPERALRFHRMRPLPKDADVVKLVRAWVNGNA